MTTCAFTGHRPGRFKFTHESDDLCVRIKNALTEEIMGLYEKKEVRTFYSGGAVGVDMWAAEAVLKLRDTLAEVRHVCVIPFVGHCDRWQYTDIARLKEVQAQSDNPPPISPRYTESVYKLRNKYMIDRADYLIAVYDEKVCSKSGTGQTVRMAREKDIPILLIHPDTAAVSKIWW